MLMLLTDERCFYFQFCLAINAYRGLVKVTYLWSTGAAAEEAAQYFGLAVWTVQHKSYEYHFKGKNWCGVYLL